MKIAVLGAGVWGSALAMLFNSRGHEVRLWDFFPEWIVTLQQNKANPNLPDIHFSDDIIVTSDLEQALDTASIIVLVASSRGTRNVARMVKPLYAPGTLIVNCSKGIEPDTGKRMSSVIGEEIPMIPQGGIVTLSGPSLAMEVAKQMPTTVVAASWDIAYAREIQAQFMTPAFRIYTSADLIGVELGGTLKNIIAIAAGICDGLGWGQNTKGALLTRGLAEISRLGVSLGGNQQTFAGLSGMGDLVTTCESRLSRNRYVGEQLGKGLKLPEILKEMNQIAEGVETTDPAWRMAHAECIEMPITEQMHAIMFNDTPPEEAVKKLMTREPKPERI